MKHLSFVLAFIFSVLPQISIADDASYEALRKAHNKQMIKQWEWNKDALKDEYKKTKSYKKKNPSQQRDFDKDWSNRRERGRTMQW